MLDRLNCKFANFQYYTPLRYSNQSLGATLIVMGVSNLISIRAPIFDREVSKGDAACKMKIMHIVGIIQRTIQPKDSFSSSLTELVRSCFTRLPGPARILSIFMFTIDMF